MADKEKRFRKILLKRGLKGRLKSVATLEEAHVVLVNEKEHSKTQIMGKGTYLEKIERGYTFPEEEVYYAISPNPRDTRHIEDKLLSNAFSYEKITPK